MRRFHSALAAGLLAGVIDALLVHRPVGLRLATALFFLPLAWIVWCLLVRTLFLLRPLERWADAAVIALPVSRMETEGARSEARAAQMRADALERELKAAKDDLGKLAVEAEASAVSEAEMRAELDRIKATQKPDAGGAREDLARERARAEEQEKLRAQAEKDLSDLKDELEAAAGREAAMSDEIETAHRDSGSRALLTSALEREQNLRSELAAAVARAEATKKELSGIRAGLSAEAAKRSEMQRKVDGVNADNPPTGKRPAGDREAKAVQAERDAAAERATRAEAHAAELQAMLDGVGRERAQLRSEASALRTRVESLTSAAARARSLIAEADDLRSDAGFAVKERLPTPPPPPPVQAAAPTSSTGPVPLPRPTRKK